MKILTLLSLASLERNRQGLWEALRPLPFVGKMADLGLNSAAPILNAISPKIARRLLDGEYDPDYDYNDNKYLSSSWESFTASAGCWAMDPASSIGRLKAK